MWTPEKKDVLWEMVTKRNIPRHISELLWPTNPPAPRRGATRLRSICSILYIWPPFAMESYYSLAFFAFSHFGSSEGSISHFSCLMSQVLLDCLLYRKKIAHRHQTTRGSGSGMTPESYENSSIFEPISKATKAMKIRPKATQNHENSTLTT